ncbi:dipicolinate synthase subunit B [Roseburia sp. 499]|uniref:dipicolinate synthase subunit B n=1 Tax=Roseburia sp. 499 TaxID=1261634 RepID=UPI0009513956|nr:dipicolinate synthase subunit B [Roseburia sp. 499]WVK69367.1 dipicolinate synthase subunit B [Roseburia sp. 499]
MIYNFQGKSIGIGFTGSFCTYEKVFHALEELKQTGASLLPVFSVHAATLDSRFGTSLEFLERARKLTGKDPITTIPQAEPIGPKGLMDIMVIAPCTGNTLSKLANGISDTPVLMAAKSHLRNNRPLVISLSTNDALGMNLKNIGILLNTKNIYFVPFGQDNFKAKPNSMTAFTELLPETIAHALNHQQIQPVIRSPH